MNKARNVIAIFILQACKLRYREVDFSKVALLFKLMGDLGFKPHLSFKTLAGYWLGNRLMTQVGLLYVFVVKLPGFSGLFDVSSSCKHLVPSKGAQSTFDDRLTNRLTITTHHHPRACTKKLN